MVANFLLVLVNVKPVVGQVIQNLKAKDETVLVLRLLLEKVEYASVVNFGSLLVVKVRMLGFQLEFQVLGEDRRNFNSRVAHLVVDLSVVILQVF